MTIKVDCIFVLAKSLLKIHMNFIVMKKVQMALK